MIPYNVPIPDARVRSSHDACAAFLSALYAPASASGHFCELRPIPSIGQATGQSQRDPIRRWIPLSDPSALAAAALAADRAVRARRARFSFDRGRRLWVEAVVAGAPPGQVYYTVQPRSYQGGTEADVQGFVALYADLELEKGGHSLRECGPALLAMRCPPSAIVWSGHGCHAYWFLSSYMPLVNAQRARLLTDGIARALCAWNPDPKVKDASRVLRLPGTHNRKGGEERAVELCYLAPARRYSIAQLEDAFPAARPRALSGPAWALPVDDLPPFDLGSSWHESTRSYLSRCRTFGASDAQIDQLAVACATCCPADKRTPAQARAEAARMAEWAKRLRVGTLRYRGGK